MCRRRPRSTRVRYAGCRRDGRGQRRRRRGRPAPCPRLAEVAHRGRPRSASGRGKHVLGMAWRTVAWPPRPYVGLPMCPSWRRGSRSGRGIISGDGSSVRPARRASRPFAVLVGEHGLVIRATGSGWTGGNAWCDWWGTGESRSQIEVEHDREDDGREHGEDDHQEAAEPASEGPDPHGVAHRPAVALLAALVMSSSSPDRTMSVAFSRSWSLLSRTTANIADAMGPRIPEVARDRGDDPGRGRAAARSHMPSRAHLTTAAPAAARHAAIERPTSAEPPVTSMTRPSTDRLGNMRGAYPVGTRPTHDSPGWWLAGAILRVHTART